MRKVQPLQLQSQAGFTLIEMIMAMAVFSMLLLIVVVGFINVTHMRNRAVAYNEAQDNARVALEEVMQAVRAASGSIPARVAGIPPTGASLCLANTLGAELIFYLSGGVLYRAEGCTARLNAQALTTNKVLVSNFAPRVVASSGSAGSKPQIEVDLTVATNNGSTAGSGAGITCDVPTGRSSYCAVVTLQSGATPR